MIDPHKPVRVFHNYVRGCYSIMQGSAVVASASAVRLTDVEFRVRESGRQRMLRTQRRNVHAYALGLLEDYVHPGEVRQLEALDGRGVFYDPHRFDSFVDRETHVPVSFVRIAQFDQQGVIYADGEFVLAAA